jgi:IclR family acetate operon transcriptional repressor
MATTDRDASGDGAADPPGPRTGAQAVERAVAILQAFDGPADLGVSEIAERVGLRVPTAHRIVRALVAGGLLGQDATTDRYHLGVTTAVLGQLALDRLGFSAAVPDLERLAETTGEAVNLGVRVASDVMVVLHVPSSQPLRFEQRPGTRVPLHVSAMGKVLLAYGGLEAVEGEKLARFTARSITSRARLDKELAEVRRAGYAINDEERNVGVRAVAVPLLDANGAAIAAVALQGPTVRITDQRVPRLVRTLRSVVDGLTR